MSSFNLLSGKFSAAKLPEICAPRRNLINLFQRAANKRVVFVSAPAGYGKTISTQLWLNDSGFEPIWIGLDGYDNTPSIFYKLLCTGILSALPENTVMADMLKSPAFMSTPVEHTIRLLSEFVPDDKRYAVVLDDMHLVTNEEVRKSGLLVQKRLPSSFVTFILTRNDIAEEYQLLVGKEDLAIINAQDLAFSVDEIQKYFDAQGRFITMAEAQTVHGITSGWAIAVNALAMSGQIEPGQSGGPVLGNFIKTHIWDKWDAALRGFMLRTSIVDVMTAELAKRLSGCENSKDILEDLCAKNSFIRHITEDTYCYHPLFLDFLRSMQAQSDELLCNALYKTAADYYLETGDYFSTRRYALKSGNAKAINASYELINTGRSISIDEYVHFHKTLLNDLIPEAVCRQNPYMYGTYIWYYCLMGNAQKMEYYLDMLYEHLPQIIQYYPQFSEISILITTLDHRVSFSQKIEQFCEFPAIANIKNQLQGTSITMQLPYAHRTLRDFYELTDESIMARAAGSFGRLLATQYEAAVLEIRSGFLYERNHLNEALRIALQTQHILNEDNRDEIIFCNFMHLASIYSAMGNEKMFAETIEQTERYINKNGSFYFRPNFTAFKTKIQLMNCDKNAAKAWLDNYYVIETEQIELYKIFQYFTTARACIVLSQTNKAMNYILKLKKLGTDFHRPLDIAEASVLQAILEWALGNKNEALQTLETTLIAMQEFGFIRVFANEGASVLPILKKLAQKLQKENSKSQLTAKFLNKVTIAAYEQSKRHKGVTANIPAQKPIKLSKQQKYIVELLSKGYKNAEIAQISGLSIHTVKSHCAAAYAKLEVNTAMDAVLKAKELGIIE